MSTIVERIYQRQLTKRIKNIFPGCIVLKNDPSFLQGIPDILVLFKDKWAMLELKRYTDSVRQANQEYYVKLFNKMSFAAFINPANEEEVLNDLQSAFRSAREARVSKP